MSANDLRIEWMRLDDLVPAERNSKRHDLDELDETVRHLGFTTELRVDERTGRLIRGHGRLAYLRRQRDRGAEAPEGIRDLGDDWAAPVVRGWASRGEHHASAVKIADNDVGRKAGHDDAALLDELADLAADAPELLRATAHNSEDLDRLREAAEVTVLAPVDDHDYAADADRSGAPDLEQWQPGDDPDEGSTTEEPPGPLDVDPAWRTLHPWRAIYHAGGERGAQKVADWLRPYVRDVAAHADTTLGRWYVWGREGMLIVREGEWVTRDGQDGALQTWSAEEFADRFVPANEPARRVQRDAKPMPAPKAAVPPTVELIRRGRGVVTAPSDTDGDE